MFYSSAVDQTRHPDGLVAARLRQRGIAGEDGLAFVEYSAAVPDDEGREFSIQRTAGVASPRNWLM
jgi:hypothetical protein